MAETGRGVRAAAWVLLVPPLVALIEAGGRALAGWRWEGRAEAAVLAGFGLLALVPALILLVPSLARRPLAARLLAVQCAVLASLSLLEGAVRTLAPLPAEPSPWPPGLRMETDTCDAIPGLRGPAVFTTNARGFRGPDADPADAVRIVAIGGSTTECLYLDDSEEWPGLVRRGLAEATGRRVWLGNAGKAAMNTADHLVHLRELPEVEGADAVVILAGINDLFRHLGGTWPRAEADAAERALHHALPRAGTPWVLRSHLLARLRSAVRGLAARADGERTAVQDDGARWVTERRAVRARFPRRDDLPDFTAAAETYADMVRRLVETARARRTRLLLLTQPTLYGPAVDPATEPLIYGSVLQGQGFAWSTPALHRAMEMLNAAMERVAAETGTACVPLHRLLPRDPALIYDDCHFTEEGARRVAAAVLPTLGHVVRGEPVPPYPESGGGAPATGEDRAEDDDGR